MLFVSNAKKNMKKIKATHLFLFLPNILQRFQVETFFGQYTAEGDGLIAMIQIRFEELNENWPECMLQVDAFVLVGQFVHIVFERMNESLHHFGSDFGFFRQIVTVFSQFKNGK